MIPPAAGKCGEGGGGGEIGRGVLAKKALRTFLMGRAGLREGGHLENTSRLKIRAPWTLNVYTVL